jgi:hypothetical protein
MGFAKDFKFSRLQKTSKDFKRLQDFKKVWHQVYSNDVTEDSKPPRV